MPSLRRRRQLAVEVATAHKVAGMFGRRDPMRKYMDQITALADDLGAAPLRRLSYSHGASLRGEAEACNCVVPVVNPSRSSTSHAIGFDLR